MPNIAVRGVSYLDDFGETHQFNVKIRDDMAAKVPWYLPAVDVDCGVTKIFTPRHFKATYRDGSTIQIVVPNVAGMDARIKEIWDPTDPDKAVCVDLVGEKWTLRPGKGTAGITYSPPSARSPKITGTIQYTADVINGVMSAKVAIEQEPAALVGGVTGCYEPVTPNTPCTAATAGFRTRHFVAMAPNGTTGGMIVRKVPAKNPADLISCENGVAAVALCVGYKGESVRNAHLYTDPSVP